MKILGTVLLLLVTATSFAFADGADNAQTAPQGAAPTAQGPQDSSGVVVKKNKKMNKSDTSSGAQTGAQGSQGGSSN